MHRSIIPAIHNAKVCNQELFSAQFVQGYCAAEKFKMGEQAMAQTNPCPRTTSYRSIFLRDCICEMLGPELTEQQLTDPDQAIDAAMDCRISRNASPELLRQTERTLFEYIAWLLDRALPLHPSWVDDQIRRAISRLVELKMLAKSAHPKPN